MGVPVDGSISVSIEIAVGVNEAEGITVFVCSTFDVVEIGWIVAEEAVSTVDGPLKEQAAQDPRTSTPSQNILAN